MKTSLRMTKYFLFTLILFSLSLRISKIGNHEAVTMDSWDYHSRAENLIIEGSDPTFHNFFSFFGWYPGSNPLGAKFLLSEFALVTGLSNNGVVYEISVLLLSQYFSILGILGIFMFSRAIIKDNNLALISVSVLCVSRTFLPFTLWIFSYRVVLMSLFPCVFFIIVKLVDRQRTNARANYKLFFLCIFSIFSILSIHRTSLFVSVVVISAITAELLYFLIRKNISFRFYTSTNANILLLSLLIASFTFFTFIGSFYNLGIQEIPTNITSFLSLILSYITKYSMSIGIILGFMPIGVILIINKTLTKKKFLFIYLLILSYMPFYGDLSYAILYFHILLVFMSAIGFYAFIDNFNLTESNKFFTIVMTFLLINIIPNYIEISKPEEDLFIGEERMVSTEIHPKVYDCAVFLRTYDSADGVSFSGIHHIAIGNNPISSYYFS